MSKIATSFDKGGDERALRQDIARIRERINGMQTVSTGWTSFSNLSTDKTCDADATTTAELADILGTLIETLKDAGILGE